MKKRLQKILSGISNYQQALKKIDSYFKEKDIIITRFLIEIPICHQITLFIGEEIYTIKLHKFLIFKWWVIKIKPLET